MADDRLQPCDSFLSSDSTPRTSGAAEATSLPAPGEEPAHQHQGVVLPLHVRTGEPEHLEKRWQEAVAPVLTEPFNAKGVAGDLALRMDCLESEVNVAIAARLEKLEKEVFSVSSRLQMNLLDLEVKGPSSTSRSGMIGVTKADPKRAIERLDSKLDGAVHQLMEQVQQLRSMTTERFRETEQKIADCQAALTSVCAPHGRDIGLVQSDLEESLPKTARSPCSPSFQGRLERLGAFTNSSPKARPLCRRRGWASGAFRTAPASPSVQPHQTESVDFFAPPAAAALPDANIQELVHRVSEMQRVKLQCHGFHGACFDFRQEPALDQLLALWGMFGQCVSQSVLAPSRGIRWHQQLVGSSQLQL